MSDIFEQDINEDEENLSELEDKDNKHKDDSDDEFIYPENLYSTKLEYSCEIVYAALPKNIKELNPKDHVIIPTRYGKDLALVLGKVNHPVAIKKHELITIERKASDADMKRFAELSAQEEGAFKIFREKVASHNLDMKLVAVHFLLEESKALFFFSSDNRVDFRELVKDLVSVFRMRIELRQIGVRDESRITGGLGVCGRPYCCHIMGDRLPPVSIKMAKEQNLSLNSTKISGQCGRLLCCLSYECKCYTEARKNLPSEGLRIFYDDTNFRITDVDPLRSIIRMQSEDGRILEIPGTRFYKENGRWKID